MKHVDRILCSVIIKDANNYKEKTIIQTDKLKQLLQKGRNDFVCVCVKGRGRGCWVCVHLH